MVTNGGRVLVIIAYRDFDGDLHGINAWPATGNDLRIYEEWESTMAKKIDQTLSEQLRQESEKPKTTPTPRVRVDRDQTEPRCTRCV
jgi:hypothetical protein